MQGMSKTDWKNGKSTRSGLLWEVERILKEMEKEELPDVLLMENVPQVHAEQNEADFNEWLSFLKSKGYISFWKDLNAKDFGIPQNRVRCFCVSFLSDNSFMDFQFPEPVILDKVMKDFLEEHVEEKYYIKNVKSDKLIKELIESGVLPTENREIIRPLTCVSRGQEKLNTALALRQDMMQEFANTNQKEGVYVNLCRIEKIGCKIAKTLCARDSKGFGTGWDTMNGVIECKN